MQKIKFQRSRIGICNYQNVKYLQCVLQKLYKTTRCISHLSLGLLGCTLPLKDLKETTYKVKVNV